MMDTELEKVADVICSIKVNTTADREHVGEIECGIRVVKERAQCIVLTLSFRSLHKEIVIHMIYYVLICINSIPNKNGISQN